ncbi:MAG: hypothetical protein K2F87_02135 [Muribaculaceae bacterium]|nr:hypothetical protein [Muribaculaceae bacterium]
MISYYVVDPAQMLPIQLKSGSEARKLCNLKDTPGNVNYYVKLHGNFGKKYMGVNGLRDCAEAEYAVPIPYNNFTLAIDPFEEVMDTEYYMLEDGTDEFTIKNVEFPQACQFILVGGEYADQYFEGEATLTDENLSCELTYGNFYTLTEEKPMPEMPFADLTGTYDVTVKFDGAKAKLTFVKAGEAPAGPELYLVGANVNGAEWTPDAAEGKMTLTGDGLYEWNGNVLGDQFKVTDGSWEGDYNIGAGEGDLVLGEPYTYYNDGNSGNIKFANNVGEVQNAHVVLNLNEGTITVTGDAIIADPADIVYYLRGTINDWSADEAYSFTPAEDGTYQLLGVEIQGAGEFKIADATWGKANYGSANGGFLEADQVYPVVNGSNPDNISYDLDGTYDVIFDPNADEPYVLFQTVGGGGEEELSDYALQLDSGYVYGTKMADGSVLYKNVKFEGEGNFAVLDAFSYEHYYGDWDITISDDNLSVVLPEDFDYTPAAVDLTGYYDVTVKFGEEMKDVTVTCVKVGDLMTNVNVAVENGASFTYKTPNFSESEFTVALADSNWSLVSYTYNDQPEESLEAIASYTLNFEAGNENNFLFVAEYTGVCKLIEGSVDVAEFEESPVVIRRVNGNIEIENLNVGDPIVVYTLGGQVIGSYVATDKTMTIELGAGQYVVRAGNVAAKVIM